jgi:hypothetical protein
VNHNSNVKVTQGEKNMTEERKQVEVGNRTIDASSEFEEGYCEGRLYYYDTNNQLRQPLTSEQLYDLLAKCFKEALKRPQWQAGFIMGLMAALCENDPNRGFTSTIILPEKR